MPSLNPRPPLAAIALISAAAIAYQILLARLFSIIQWHHFAYMMISMAMLGYGVSGTLLSLLRERLLPHYERVFIASAAIFGMLAVSVFLLAQQLPFNPLEILWDIRQPLYLLLFYLLLSLPFGFAACCIGITFARHGAVSHRIYCFDLFGAASGGLIAVLLLYLLPPIDVLRAVGLMGLSAAALAVWHFRRQSRLLLPLLGMIAIVMMVELPARWTDLKISPYKSLMHALQVPGAHVLEQRYSPLGMLTVVDTPRVPFRHAPGLSLNATQEPPPQLGIFIDGDAFSALTRFDGQLAPLAYLDQTTSALPYHLLSQPRVLVLGAGGGSSVLQALLHQAAQVDAVDADARMVELVRERFSEFSGGLYRRPEVALHVSDARAFVEASEARYDLIQVDLLDAFGAASSGLYGLSENYLFTVQGLRAYLKHLKPGGLLALTRWVTLPPRDMLKLAATTISALEQEGASSPGKQLALIRGWQTATLLVKNGEFGTSDMAAIRAFAEARSFDVEWLPGGAREDGNRYNVLDQPYFYDGIAALLGVQSADFIAGYKFDIRPTSDDRPYFHHFFRWQTLPEILQLKARGGLSLLELGYPILLATLLQAVLASAVLIVLPLWLGLRKQPAMRAAPAKRATFAYFISIGFAFIFIEITFIQKFTLYLGHPLYAMAGVLCAMLLFAGLGSRSAPHLLARLQVPGVAPLTLVAAGIALLVVLNLLASAFLMEFGAGLPAMARVALVMLLIAPLAFLMGMPFPLGMARLDAIAPALLPWAWGVNACATVVGAALAVLLALHFAFSGVAFVAVILYMLAAAAFQRMADRPNASC